MFKHDAPKKSASLFDQWDSTNFSKYLKLHFFGKGGEIDRMMQRTVGTSYLKGRGYVIHQWISVLNEINNLYFDNDQIITLEEINQKVAEINSHLMEDCLITTDEEVVNHEISLFPLFCISSFNSSSNPSRAFRCLSVSVTSALTLATSSPIEFS